MKKLNKIQIVTRIVVVALALLSSLANTSVFGTLARLSARHAIITFPISDNSSNAKTNNSNPSQPTSISSYTVINYPNGTKVVVFTHVDPNTLPQNTTESVFVTVYSSVNMRASITGSGNYPTVIISPVWFFLEDLFETMQDAKELLDLLFGIACILELSKKFKFPKLPPSLFSF
jgi:hypothetical protein